MACSLAVLLISSCVKKKTLPIVPAIDYKSFSIIDNSTAMFVYTFSDGDGDIGLRSSDTTGSYSRTSPYYYNLYMKYLYKNSSGNYVPYIYFDMLTGKFDTIILKYRTQYIESTTKDQSLTGEVYVTMNGYRPTTTHKNFKYEFYIYDRGLHKSNVITTPVFTTN